jgi:hypothetical protein
MRSFLPPVLSMAALCAALAGCAASRGTGRPTDGVRDLGESFKATNGEVSVIRAQDDYTFLRCVPGGPIAGCFEGLMVVPRAALSEDSADGISWNQWIDVDQVPGLKVMFLSPNRLVFRDTAAAAK